MSRGPVEFYKEMIQQMVIIIKEKHNSIQFYVLINQKYLPLGAIL